MNQFKGKTALVTGGSRGIGRGIVEALAAEGIHVWAMARDAERLTDLKRDLPGVETLIGDVTDSRAIAQAMRDVQPDILVLNAGATPTMAPIYEQTWEQFNGVWENDVQATFHFGREALLMPMKPGSVVVIVSSGAALGGSVLSGSYASAKRAQWFMGQYFQQEANNLKLGIRFVVLVPKQIVGTTELGDKAATRYAALQGITKAQFLERMGTSPLTPRAIGDGVLTLLSDAAYGDGLAFGINSDGLAALN